MSRHLRICSSLLVVALVCTGAATAGPRGFGTGSTTDTVEGEILRRQNEIIEAERLIAEGDALRTDGDYGGAAGLYGQAYSGLSPSPLAESTIAIARERFAAASVRHSIELIDAAQFAKAHTVLDEVLSPDVHPRYQPALTVKKRLADPEWYNTARTPEHHANVEKVNELLIKGKGAFDIADWELAQDYYTQVLRIDRYNAAARRGQLEAEQQMIKYLGSARDHTKAKMLRMVDDAWETEVEISDSFGLGGATDPGGDLGQLSVQDALSTLMVDRLQFDQATLDEVIAYLSTKSKQIDPAGDGINFVLKVAPEDIGLRDTRVTLQLSNVPLLEALKLITRNTGTRYRVDGFAVVIESATAGTDILISERFRVPPDFLSSAPDTGGAALDDPFATGDITTNSLGLRRLTAKEFLEKQGVTFPDGASATLLPTSSTLLVRNTLSNVEIIRSIVSATLSGAPKQAEIHVTMIDVSQSSLNEIGFDWLLGQFNVPGSDRVFGGGGTVGNSAISGGQSANSLNNPFTPPGSTTPLGENPLTSGIRSGEQWNQGDSINDILLGTGESVLSSSGSILAPANFALAGPFTDPQFQLIMRGLSQSKGVDIITSPSTVTRSGQRAAIDILREFPYASEYDPPEIPQDTSLDFEDGTSLGSNGAIPVTPAHPAAFEVRNLGTHLEVEPIIGDDNFTVELNLSPEFVQFEGFVNYGAPINTTATNALGGEVAVEVADNRILQPIFKTIRTTNSVTVWDGQTVAFGGLIEDRTQRVEDKTPLLGDAPLIGRFFRTQGADRSMRVVMFFVRVHVIDPSGKRINVPEVDAAGTRAPVALTGR